MRFACPHCNTPLNAQESKIGMVCKCSRCGEQVKIPRGAVASSPHETAGPAAPLRLPGLNPTLYEHPFDKRALDALEKTPGLPRLVSKLNGLSVERMNRILYAGSNLRVSKECIPEFYAIFQHACDILHLPKIPSLYIEWKDEVDALTAGVVQPMVVVTAGVVDRLSEAEQLFVLGHEIGHIKSEHVLYHQVGQWLPVLSEMIGDATFGIGELLSKPVELALLHWIRMSELTADRAGLLACQDHRAATTTFMKIAGLPESYRDMVNPDAFIAQAREFQEFDFQTLDKVLKLLLAGGAGHPWTVMRAGELLKWIDGGGYQSILNQFGACSGSQHALEVRFCPNCGFERRKDETCCTNCGTEMR